MYISHTRSHFVGTCRKNCKCGFKDERINNKKINLLLPVSMGITSSLPAALSWCILRFSMGKYDFYRWHKIINGYFLQIYNFIEPDASSSALSAGGSQYNAYSCIYPYDCIFHSVFSCIQREIIKIEK